MIIGTKTVAYSLRRTRRCWMIVIMSIVGLLLWNEFSFSVTNRNDANRNIYSRVCIYSHSVIVLLFYSVFVDSKLKQTSALAAASFFLLSWFKIEARPSTTCYVKSYMIRGSSHEVVIFFVVKLHQLFAIWLAEIYQPQAEEQKYAKNWRFSSNISRMKSRLIKS